MSSRLCIGLLSAVFAQGAFAVEVPSVVSSLKQTTSREGAVEGRWAVVGIISSGDEGKQKGFGIAVVKNLGTNRTYTLSIGDSLPSDYEGFVLESVIGKRVTVSNGHSHTTLPFAESSVEDGDGQQSRTARFIDNYYRGLGQMPGQMLGSGEGEALPLGGAQLQRFSSLKEDGARSRFELYKTDRVYGSGSDAESETDSGEFVVNYDNFEPDVAGGLEGSSEVPEQTKSPIGQAIRQYEELREARDAAASRHELPPSDAAAGELMEPAGGELMNETMTDNLLGE